MDGDISQLKSFALSLNEELKALHSKQLFTKFKTNQIEFLLEEIKNGKFDEEKLKLQKRVEWHILNAVTNRSENDQYPYLVVKSAKNTENIISHVEDRKIETQQKYQEEEKDIDLSSAKRDYNARLQKPILKNKSLDSNLKGYHRSLKSRIKVIDNSDKYSNKISKLKVTFNPCISIPPLSRSHLPSVNINPRRDLPQSLAYIPSSTNVGPNSPENYRDIRPPLQKVQNASVHILPLSKQRQPCLSLLPKKKKSVLNNQALITCQHSQVTSEDADPSSEEMTSSFNGSGLKEEYKEEVSTSGSIFQASENHSREINEYYSLPEKSYDSRPSPVTTNRYKIHRQIDGQSKHQDFDSIRFINRLEERLSSALIPLPSTKFIKKIIENQQEIFTKSVDSQTSPDEFGIGLLSGKSLRKTQEKCNDASSQAGNSFIKEFTKNEYIQTVLPECPNSSNENAKDQYNSSFETDENTEEDSEINSIIDDKEKREEVEQDQNSSGEKPLEFLYDADRDHCELPSMTHSNDVFDLDHTIEPDSREDYKENGLRNNLIPVEESLSKSELLKNDEASLEDKENSLREFFPSSGSIKDIEDIEESESEEQISVPEGNLIEELSEVESNSNKNEIICSPIREKSGIVSGTKSPDAEVISEDPNSKSVEVDPSNGFRHVENSSLNSDGANHFGSLESADVEETILPSIEIGDVTISEGEIEFEASISDIQPGNRIAIKFSTKDFGKFSNQSNNLRPMCQLDNKETQTNLDDPDSDVVQHSSFSDGVLILQSDKEISSLNDISEENEETTVNFSEGELLGKESPLPHLALDPKEKESIERENQILLKRLANFTGRFCIK